MGAALGVALVMLASAPVAIAAEPAAAAAECVNEHGEHGLWQRLLALLSASLQKDDDPDNDPENGGL